MEHAEIAGIIKRQLTRRGLTPYRAAVDSGMPENSIRYALEGRATRSDRLIEICNVLGLEFYIGAPRETGGKIAGLDVGLDRRTLKTLAEKLDALAERLPPPASAEPDVQPRLPLSLVADVRAAAGDGAEVFEETEVEITIPVDALPKGTSSDHAVALRADGDSMEPTIHSGDILVIDHSDREPRDGRVCVLRTDTGLVVKRLRREGAGWRMTSDNPDWPSRLVGEGDRILGHAIWFGPERAVSVGG